MIQLPRGMTSRFLTGAARTRLHIATLLAHFCPWTRSMPEQPPGKRLPPDAPRRGPRGGAYAELHCRTNFSFLEGASHGDELVTRAVELGLAALAVTDRNSLAGVVRAHVAAKTAGLKLLIGAELTPIDAPPLLVWAPDRATYGRLARLLTVGRRAAPKGECRLTFDDLAAHASGMLVGVLLPPLLTMPDDEARRHLRRYRELFGDRCYAILELHRGPDDERRLQRMMRLAGKVPLLAANDVHYHVPERRPLQDVLTALRHKCTVAELGERRFPNAERHLKDAAAMTELFHLCPAAVGRTLEVAERCTFSLDELRYEYPEELSPPGLTPLEYLTRLTWEGAHRRYPDHIPDKVRQLVEHELTLIADLHYEAYFLTVWDLVEFARGRQILCQGRGRTRRGPRR
jgi:error-prone DNA polymerase